MSEPPPFPWSIVVSVYDPAGNKVMSFLPDVEVRSLDDEVDLHLTFRDPKIDSAPPGV